MTEKKQDQGGQKNHAGNKSNSKGSKDENSNENFGSVDEEQNETGKKGGKAVNEDHEHMSDAGKKGGRVSGGKGNGKK